MWLKVVVSTFVLMAASEGNSNNSTLDQELDFKELVGGLSDQNQASLVNPEYDTYMKNFTAHYPPTRPYEQFQPSSLLRGQNWYWGQIRDKMANEDNRQSEQFRQYVNRNRGFWKTRKACHVLSSIYQRAKTDILKYYKFREFYINTLEYEVGYLCHVVIAKYMNMLELYDIVIYRFTSPEAQAEKEMTMPNRYMFFIYINIVEYSKSIIYYCNMLHEIEYKYEQYNDGSLWDDGEDSEEATMATLSLNKHHMQFEEYLDSVRDKNARIMKENYKKQQRLQAGITYSPSHKPRPARYWVPKRGGVDYGWSIEDW